MDCLPIEVPHSSQQKMNNTLTSSKTIACGMEEGVDYVCDCTFVMLV